MLHSIHKICIKIAVAGCGLWRGCRGGWHTLELITPAPEKTCWDLRLLWCVWGCSWKVATECRNNQQPNKTVKRVNYVVGSGSNYFCSFCIKRADLSWWMIKYFYTKHSPCFRHFFLFIINNGNTFLLPFAAIFPNLPIKMWRRIPFFGLPTSKTTS